MQRAAHILNKLDRAVGARGIRHCKLEAAFIGSRAYSGVIIVLRRGERSKVHLSHGREVQLESPHVADGFFKFGGDRLTYRENNRVRAAGRGRRAARRGDVALISIAGIPRDKPGNRPVGAGHAEARMRETYRGEQKVGARGECQ